MLVVDDEADALLMERLALEIAGYRVLGAASAEEALLVLEREAVEAMVLDLRLPGMDGWALLEKLRDVGKLDHLPVIVATAHSSELTAKAAANAGCRAYLVKPFKMERLRETVDQLLAS